ncbi:MAG: DUF423 domain-containing protein [Rhodobacteraceae bacterium]|nr:DUF423 domain-containing protein [Paracoccaceae bacterium]
MPLSRPALGITLFAVVNGLIAQVLEGYAAHGLVEIAGDYAPTLYHTSAKYHMWHVLALFFVVLIYDRVTVLPARVLLWVTVALFSIGMVMFSGGMYGVPFGASIYITVAGAILLQVGWGAFVLAIAAALVVRTGESALKS